MASSTFKKGQTVRVHWWTGYYKARVVGPSTRYGQWCYLLDFMGAAPDTHPRESGYHVFHKDFIEGTCDGLLDI